MTPVAVVPLLLSLSSFRRASDLPDEAAFPLLPGAARSFQKELEKRPRGSPFARAGPLAALLAAPAWVSALPALPAQHPAGPAPCPAGAWRPRFPGDSVRTPVWGLACGGRCVETHPEGAGSWGASWGGRGGLASRLPVAALGLRPLWLLVHRLFAPALLFSYDLRRRAGKVARSRGPPGAVRWPRPPWGSERRPCQS